MSETAFNGTVRDLLRNQGLQVLHIREADQIGVLDLLIYTKRDLICWMELKVDDEEVRASQREFAAKQEALRIPCLLARLHTARDVVELSRFDLNGREFRKPLGELRNWTQDVWPVHYG